MTQSQKTYLMLGGTFLPAFVCVTAYAGIKKQWKPDVNSMLILLGASAVGGYITAKMLKE